VLADDGRYMLRQSFLDIISSQFVCLVILIGIDVSRSLIYN
jgi:hypothetical protein